MLLVGVEAIGGLVHDEHGWVVQDRLCEAHAPLEALGQGIDPLAEHCLQSGARDRRVDGLGRGLAFQTANAGDETEELQRRHVGIGWGTLGQVADGGLGLELLLDDVVAANGYAAFRGGEEAGDHLHRGGLAGTIGAQEAQHLALADKQRDAAHGCEVPEPPDQVFDNDHGNAREPAKKRAEWMAKPIRETPGTRKCRF